MCTNEKPLQKFIEKKIVNFSLKDKQTVTQAAVKYCTNGMNSFHSISNNGLGELLYDTSVVANKYGKMSKESFLDLLPAPNTVGSIDYFYSFVICFFFYKFSSI